MCDQTQVTYKPNDIVWVKLSNVWWPAQVQDQETLDKDVTQGLKKKPLAVVKFFNEDFYEFIKNLDQIYHYNCLKKNEFIQKGLDLCRPNNSRTVSSSMSKFPEDVRQAEIITGGNPDICADPMFKGKIEEKIDTSFSEHDSEYLRTPKSAIKRSQDDSSGEPSRKHIRFSLPSFSSDSNEFKTPISRAPSSVNVAKTVPHRPVKSHSSTDDSSASKPSPVRPLSDEVVEKIKKKNYQANIRIQPSSEPTPPMNKGKIYRCFHCEDSTNRLNLIIQHYRAHEAHGMNVLKMSPQIPATMTASSPASSKGSTFSTPKIKNEKNKTSTTSKKSTTTPIKKKTVKNETPQSQPSSRSNRTPQLKKKQKKTSKSKDSEVDQNKVLRDKILKDWDDESDEDENCGSKVFSTVAEIHCSSNSRRTPSPISPEKDSTVPSAAESVDMETIVSSTNDINSGDVSKDDTIIIGSRENDIQTELTSANKVEEKEKSCFDFEDNDEAINLDKSHKFGQKLPRVISEEKTRKQVSMDTGNVECTTQSSREDINVLQIQLEKLLEDTKLREVPELPKSGFPPKIFHREENDKQDDKLHMSETEGISSNSERVLTEESISSPQGNDESKIKNDFTDEKEKSEILKEVKRIEVPESHGLTNKNEERSVISEEHIVDKIDNYEDKVIGKEIFSGTLNEEKVHIEEHLNKCLNDSVQENKELLSDNEQALDMSLENDKKNSQQSEESEPNYDVTTNQKLKCKEKLVVNLHVQQSNKEIEMPKEHLKVTEEDGDTETATDKVELVQVYKEPNLSEPITEKSRLDSNLPNLGDDVRQDEKKENVMESGIKDVINEKECDATSTFQIYDDKEDKKLVNETKCSKELVEEERSGKELAEDEKYEREFVENKKSGKELAEDEQYDRESAEDEKYVKELAVEDNYDKKLDDKEKHIKELGDVEKHDKELSEEEKYENVLSDGDEDNKVLPDEEKLSLNKIGAKELLVESLSDQQNIEIIEITSQVHLDKKIEKEAENDLFENITVKGNEEILKDVCREESVLRIMDVQRKSDDRNEFERNDTDSLKSEENFCMKSSIKEIPGINKHLESNEEVADVKEEVHTNVESFVEIESKKENIEARKAENENYWETEIVKSQATLDETEGDLKLEIDQEKEISAENTFTDFSVDFTKNEIEISAVEDTDVNMEEPKIAEVSSEVYMKEENSDLADMNADSDVTNEQVLRNEVIIVDTSKDAEEIKTLEFKISDDSLTREAIPSNVSTPQIQQAGNEGKYSVTPELGTYNNELLISSDLPQWTATEYYADLEAQVRNDFEVEESKHINRAGVDISVSRQSPSKSKIQSEQDFVAQQDVTKGRNDNRIIKKPQESPYLYEQENKQETNDPLIKSKSVDCTRSGVIYDFKLDYTEQSIGEVSIRIPKTKKRKWESKDPNDKAIPTSENIDSKLADANVKEKSEIEDENKDFKTENLPQNEPTETVSKKMKLDLKSEEGLTINDKHSTGSVSHEEIPSSQDTGVLPGEIIISTTESLDSSGCDLSGKFPETSLDSAKINDDVKSETVIATTNVEKEDILSDKKMQLNYTGLLEKKELDKKELTTSTFDPSQMELDINSMPVVIEEDLMQDIKLNPVTSVINPPTSTRPNVKQIRIQLRKAGENNSSLLQGTQNGKIIRIPGTSKDTTVVKKTQQIAGTSKIQTVSSLIPQRALGGSGQTMVLKMNPIQSSSVQSKYTVSKSQIRSTSGTTGQPVKLQLIPQTQQQNTKLIMHSQQKAFTGKLPRVITKTQPSPAGLTGNKTVTTPSKTGQQKLIINQKRHVISNKNIVTKASTIAVSKATSAIATQKNTKSVVVTKSGISPQPTKNIVLPAVQGTSGTTTMQIVGQNVASKVVVQRRTKTVTSAVTTVKAMPTQAGTIYIHTSQGLVPASKAVTKQILNQIPQISAPTPSKPSLPAVSSVVKKAPMNKSRQTNINILQRTQKKTRQPTALQTQVSQQQSKAQVLSIPASSISSHELILNNVPVQLQNIGTTQPTDVKMLYLVDERGQYHQVDNSPLIAIDNSGENRGVFIESNSNNEVDNLFLTFGETNVNVSTSATTPTQDILAKALANTQVLQPDTTDISDTIEGATLYVEPQYPAPTLAHNVLETSFSLNPPIMTPLEVPSSVSPQVTSISSNLIPVSTVETVVKKDVQPSMPLLTDEVEVAAGQTVYLDSSSLVTGTTQPLTFQVINSDGNIVVASSPTSSSQTITNPANGNKSTTTTNQVIFSTDLLKSESRQIGGTSRGESSGGNQTLVENIVTSQAEINIEQNENGTTCGIPIALGSSHQDVAIPIEANRQIIQTSKITRTREKRSRKDSINSEKRVKNILEMEDINKQGTGTEVLDTTRTVSEEIFQKRLEHDTIAEQKEAEEKFDGQQSRSGSNAKVISSVSYAHSIDPVENDPKIIVEEKR
uniref:PWWP domain-containing protein n=1 Tax=Panstrongylus megistus TaxID=65343 RepID=A0A069DZU6_9HEMI